MWFTGGDPVATHTLAYAAYEIIHAVSKARDPKRPDLLLDSAYVKEDKRREFNDLFREGANFFKHGDRDPHAVLEFIPGLTYIFFFYAVYGLELCGETPLDEFVVFQRWIQISHPEILPDAFREELIHSRKVEAFAQLRALPKKQFFEFAMERQHRTTS
jgi:hypothetical protein